MSRVGGVRPVMTGGWNIELVLETELGLSRLRPSGFSRRLAERRNPDLGCRDPSTILGLCRGF